MSFFSLQSLSLVKKLQLFYISLYIIYVLLLFPDIFVIKITINLANEIDVILFNYLQTKKETRFGKYNSIFSFEDLFLNLPFLDQESLLSRFILCMHSSKYINYAFYTNSLVHFTTLTTIQVVVTL